MHAGREGGSAVRTEGSKLPASLLPSPAALAAFYLLNPLTIYACVAGHTTPLSNMLALLALYSAARRWALPASLALAIQLYISPKHAPIMVRRRAIQTSCPYTTGVYLNMSVLRAITASSAGVQGTIPTVVMSVTVASSKVEPTVCAWVQIAAACIYAYGPEDVTLPSAQPPPPRQAAAQGQQEGGEQTGGKDCMPDGGDSKARSAIPFCLLLAAWLTALMLLSDAVLPPGQRMQWLHFAAQQLRQGQAALHAAGLWPGAPGHDNGAGGDGQGSDGAGFWPLHAYRKHFVFDDVSPNLGQWWYVFMEMFDDSRVSE